MARSLHLNDNSCVLRVANSSGHGRHGRRFCGDVFESAIPRRHGGKQDLAIFNQWRLVDASGMGVVQTRPHMPYGSSSR